MKEIFYEVASLEREANRHEEEKCTRIVTSPFTNAFYNLSYAWCEQINASRDENESLN